MRSNQADCSDTFDHAMEEIGVSGGIGFDSHLLHQIRDENGILDWHKECVVLNQSIPAMNAKRNF